MQVTLKKARKLMGELKTLAGSAKSSETLSFSAYRSFSQSAIDEIVQAKRVELGENLKKSVQIVRWIYDVRTLVAEANKRSGIDRIMTDLKLVEELIQKFSTVETVSSRSPTPGSDILARKLENAKKRLDSEASNPYSRDEDEVSVAVFAETDGELKVLRKQKAELEDQLTALNSAKKIVLGEELSKFLEAEGLA